MSHKLLTDKILPLVFNKGGTKFVECQFDSDSAGEDQFQSSVIFLTAIVSKGEDREEIPLIVKFEPSSEEVRGYLRTGVQFYTEVLMYARLLPLLNRNGIVEDCFARFYHGVGSGNEKIVVLEDLRPRGFRLAAERAFIDYEHLALAMDTLGRFHALSFAAKKESPDEFSSLIKRLEEPTWTDDNPFFPTIKTCIHRAVDPLVKAGKHVEVLTKFLHCVDTNLCDMMLELVAPEEPSAVLCHGDFCRNNILFRYTGEKVTDVKFFDVATSRYSSPMIDISFFLLMNSSATVRQSCWDDLLTIYHRALSTAIPGTEVPSLEDVRKEVTNNGIYGFIHCSYFLPMMLYEDNPYADVESLVRQPSENVAQDHLLVGGEAGTRLLSEMIEELLDRGCLSLQHKLLQSRSDP
uniref:CHK kinase-like domain-containing protein n=1 Tax=Graphocephala atropunctata TaxID=36148 RepID=A0A1B6LKF7_9HEMI